MKTINIKINCPYCDFNRGVHTLNISDKGTPVLSEDSSVLPAFAGVKVHIGLKHKGQSNIPVGEEVL
jgi:hypothetical protein